jgi:hypothetical protein
VVKSDPLTTYGVANVFNRFSDFPAGLAEAFFDLPASMICAALGFEFIIVDGSANAFLCFTLHLIPFSLNFVIIR